MLTSTASFDFLWFQFSFSVSNPEAQHVIYFVPECKFPDWLFTTSEVEIDWAALSLEDFSFVMDPEGGWVRTVERILHEWPSPRKAGERPARKNVTEGLEEEQAEDGDDDDEEEQEPRAKAEAGKSAIGRTEYRAALRRGHRRFFSTVLKQCALRYNCPSHISNIPLTPIRLSGLIVVLATNHLFGDLGYTRYTWTSAEQQRFLQDGTPPQYCHSLPSGVEIIPICFYTQHAETGFQGPNLRSAHYRRLNAHSQCRLVVWDIGSVDTVVRPMRLAVIPSEDLQPSEEQRTLMVNNHVLADRKPAPNVSSILSTGLFTAEYGVGSGGEMAFAETTDYDSSLWQLLNSFTLPEPLAHPAGMVRQPQLYRCTLQKAHQELEREHRQQQERGEDQDDPYEY